MLSPPKELRFIGSSRDDLSAMPQDVKHEVGTSLWQAQLGEYPANSKPLRGRLRAVREIVVHEEGNTYRAIYTTEIGDSVYVLDAFKKKSTHGISTPQRDLERIERRLRAAAKDHEKER